MSERRPTGVLGGTFDPVHVGHLAVAEHVLDGTGIERVLLLPCAVPPHKSPAALTAPEHRVAMVRMAIAGRPRLELCDLELRGQVCYTIDTLRELRRATPAIEPVFVLGLDSLVELPAWKSHERLIAEFDLVVVDRLGSVSPPAALAPGVARAIVDLPPGDEGRRVWARSNPGQGGRIFRLRMEPVPVSSREIRARVASGRGLAGLVPTAVARYIEVNRLYRQEGER